MRLRPSIILTWGVLLIMLWSGAFLLVRWVIADQAQAADVGRADRARYALHAAETARIERMRQGCRLMLTVPELRGVASRAWLEMSPESLGGLKGRLDALGALMDASCVCVLDHRAGVVAQNSGSAWGSAEELRAFLAASPQASALVAKVIGAATKAAPDEAAPEVWGLWLNGGEVYQVVGVPLMCEAGDENGTPRANGALITATRVGDDLATELSGSLGCEVSFLAAGRVVASSLGVVDRGAVEAMGVDGRPGEEPFELAAGGREFRASRLALVDPCSGTPVGTVLVQSDLAPLQLAERRVTWVFVIGLAVALTATWMGVRVHAGELRHESPREFRRESSYVSPSTRSLRLEGMMSSSLPLDYDALVRRCSGNSAVAERVIEKFATQLGDVVANLRRNVEAADTAELARTAHTLKGTAAMTGAEGVREFAESLERLGREGRLDGADGLIGSLREQIDACLAFTSQRPWATNAAPAPIKSGAAA